MNQLLSALLILSFAAALPVLGQEATPLEPDKPVERELATDDKHTFEIVLSANEFIYGEADQQSVDVVVTVYNPDGHLLKAFDSLARGPEPFQFKSEDEGTYRIEVTPFNEETGRYVMLLLRREPVATTPAGQVDQIMAAFDRMDAPGAAVAVVKEGQVVYAKGYGLANLEYEVPVTPETVFYIGSVGKQFTAFAIVLLAEQGKLSFDDDIRTYLPELHDFGIPITIRHLIHHTSGLRDYFGLLTLAGTRNGDLITQEHILEAIVGQRELNYSPGAEFLYSNSNYALLATIVERVTGQAFSMWMKDHVFEHLGMNHTLVGDHHQQIIKQRAVSYSMAQGGGYQTEVAPYSGYGAGGIYSSADDLVQWLLNFENPKVGDSDTRTQMYHRGVLSNGDTLTYAFALGIDEYKGLRRIGHGGSLAGYRSYVGHFPDQQLGVIVLNNLAQSTPTSLAMRIADAYLSEHFTEPEDEEIAEADPGREAVEIDPNLFDDYVGEYELQPGFTLTFTREDDRFFTQATGQGRFEIFPSSDSTFFLTVVKASLTFHRDPDGSVSRLTLHQGGDHVAKRIQPYKPTADELSAYAGRYYSPELETTYTFVVEDGKLIAKHQRHEDFELKPLEKDKFGGTWFFSETVFQRNEAEQITGIRVSSGRARNLLFELQEWVHNHRR